MENGIVERSESHWRINKWFGWWIDERNYGGMKSLNDLEMNDANK